MNALRTRPIADPAAAVRRPAGQVVAGHRSGTPRAPGHPGRRLEVTGRLPRRWPIATMSVLAVTAAVTALQFPFPGLRLALWRDPDALAAGQWWRLVTGLFVQADPWWQIAIVFACIAGIGVIAERLFGPGRWLLLYLGCGVVGQAFGFRWQPYDAGASVAGAGLLGAVCAWLLSPTGPPLARVRIWGAAWPLAGLVLTAAGDIHGPPLLLGFGLGALLLWRDQRRHPGGRPSSSRGRQKARSARHEKGVTR